MSVLIGGHWWPAEGPEAGDSRQFAVEVERTDADEVMVTLRGLSGDDDYGSVQLSLESTEQLEGELRRERRRDWEA